MQYKMNRELPVCQYQLSLSDEKRIYSPREFLRIYRDMAMIREFETMLYELSIGGKYQNIGFTLQNPVQFGVGYEAAVVGEAYCLDRNDLVFGAGATHGEVLAKGLSAIEKMSDYELVDVMRKYHDGTVFTPVAEAADSSASAKDVAVDFLLYGLASEIFSKKTGFQNGLGEPMSTYFMPFGSYPSATALAGSAGLAVGAALHKKNNGLGGIAVANMKAEAASCGTAWEAFCLSDANEFRKSGQKNAGLPVLFTLLHERESGETDNIIRKCTAYVGCGVNANAMHAECVNGTNPLAVIDAVARKKERLVRGEGPAILEIVCDDLLKNDKAADPVKIYREKLIRGNVIAESDIQKVDEQILRRMAKICKLAAQESTAPSACGDDLETLVFSAENNVKPTSADKAMPEVLAPRSDCVRRKMISGKVRSAYMKDGKPADKARRYNISDGLFEAVFEHLYTDASMIACGLLPACDEQDICRGMENMFPSNRFFRLATSESALASMAVGYAMCGGRVAVSLNCGDDLLRCADVLIRQAAKWRAMSGGELHMPIVVCVPICVKEGAENGDELVAPAAHIPGLKVIYPASPYDAKGLMNEALAGDDPVICFENRRIEDIGEYFEKDGVPKDSYTVKLGVPSIKKEGTDITILTVGAVLYRAIEAAKILEETYGVHAEIIDARSIVPFDYEPVLKSIEKTGKLLVVGDSTERGSVMREMASNLAEFAFDLLDAPAVAVGARNFVTPSVKFAKVFYPTAETILDAIHEKIMPLDGYEPKQRFTSDEKIRRARKGV